MKRVFGFIGVVFMFCIFSFSAFAGEYTVKKGDWVSKIVLNFPGVTTEEVCEANKDLLSRNSKGCDHIKPGWVLTIPEPGACYRLLKTEYHKKEFSDEWTKKVLLDYRHGAEDDCDFEGSKGDKKASVIAAVFAPVEEVKNENKGMVGNTANVELKEISLRVQKLEEEQHEQSNTETSPDVIGFAALGSKNTYGLGALVRYPSDTFFSYQFFGGSGSYTNKFIAGEYFYKDLAFGLGSVLRNDNNEKASALGLEFSTLWTPEISENLHFVLGASLSGMRIHEQRILARPELSVNENTLSINTPLVRKESKYWDLELGLFSGFGYNF